MGREEHPGVDFFLNTATEINGEMTNNSGQART